MIGEGIPLREAMPKFLTRKHFIVKLKMREENEEEEGLIENENEEDVPLVVCMKSKECDLIEEGDEVIMSPRHFMSPFTAFKLKDGYAYYVYSENDIIGIW